MYNEQTASKTWSGMTAEEKIESLNVQLKEIYGRFARENDMLDSENNFLRRLLAMKMGLDEKQFDQLFNRGVIGGINRF